MFHLLGMALKVVFARGFQSAPRLQSLADKAISGRSMSRSPTRVAQVLSILIATVFFVSRAVVPAATPVRGLSKVPARNVSAGYLNAIRRGTGTTAQKIAALNYEAVD